MTTDEDQLLAEALHAFRTDIHYATEMAKAANREREIEDARLERAAVSVS